MRVHGQLQVWCRISVLDRVRCRVRVVVRVTFRVCIGPRRFQVPNPQQSICLPEGLSGLHKVGCQSVLVSGFLGQTNVWATLWAGLRNPLM